MSESAFRERRIPPDEVRKIVERASKLSALEPAEAGVGQALTEAELEQRLGDLGIPPDAVKRAIAGVSPTTAAPSAGATTRVVREEEIDGMVPPDRHEQIADAIAAAMGMPGRSSAVGNRLTWVPGGILMEPAVTVHSKDGRTRVRFAESLANRGQQIVAFATLGGIAGLIGGGIAVDIAGKIARGAGMAAAQAGPIGLAVGVVMGCAAALVAIAALRRAFARRARNRNAFADAAVAQVVAAVRAAAVTGDTRTRIAEPEHVEEEPEAESAGETSEALERRR